ncbi:SusD/RagB family nutrient-binding outer membrane lipoprotein [Flavivirga spongiicola]|uniref:SusD/RagB family nutrient-binding outer membrane lipoprotein n=1 Tax=Flavivirga spongiicola TaxID=421621 RepID=A0ABU7XSA9_9FLAO|nr:SusD/RagB family nutrient-binding outer membrane lipoprotein [Flavivirga sp. MEBiC05379]MDO5978343.1 SusD/RagB family nutrient-binding outer membrane lipoprotein [Flavivirga sp. MEBiC05379]
MKKIIIYSIVSCFLLIIASSCSDDRIEQEFNDPNKITEENIPFLFTGTLQEPVLFRADYAPKYHEYRQLNKVTGLGMYIFHWSGSEWIVIQDWSGPSFHRQLQDRGSLNFMKGLSKIQAIYDGMSEEEQADNEVYIHLSSIVKAFAFQRMTDAYDDIPFLEAGQGRDGIFYPKFDSQEVVYNTTLDNLKTTVAALKSLNLSTAVQAELSQQDILNEGDLNKWIKFANSLRLRMAMRLSIVAPAKTQEVLAELNGESLVTESSDFIGIAEVDKVRLTTYGDGGAFPRGFQERGWDMNAPKFILEDIFNYKQVQDNTVDPRAYVVFQPATDGRYIPVPHYNKADSEAYLAALLTPEIAADIVNGNRYPANSSWNNEEQDLSKYNRVTYLNDKNKWPTMTPSETHLLLAEAAVRFPGVVTIPAEDSYRKAIELSIDWYYEQNSTNTLTENSTPPLEFVNDDYKVAKDPAHVATFLASKTADFTGLTNDEKIVDIFEQKVAHLNIYNTYEIWSEARRLMKDHGQLLHPMEGKVEWLERLFYSPAEAGSNPNYADVAGKDNTTTPVWWTGR